MDFNSSLLQEALLKIQNQRDQPQLINSSIKNLLHSNNLAIRPIPDGGSNLMRAVSDCLYFTTSKYQEIQALCFKYFQKLFQQKKLTRTLEKFYQNFQLLSDYCNNPELSIFDDVNLEIVSMIYKVKVIVFSVGEDSYLNSKQFNSKNHTKIIQLLWDDGIYTPVYDEQFLDHAKVAQNFVYEILGKVIDAELVNPDHDFVHLEFQHQLEKENKREGRMSPYKFPAPAEGLTLKRSFSQQNLKELDQDKEKSKDKEFSAQVGYHNLKTANERIMTQSKPQKHFTFNLNECNDDYEQTAVEESKRKFFNEFLDPWTNLLLHQNEESQECAPISPVGYKQFMYIQMQQQQQLNAYNYNQYQVPQIPPIYQQHYANAAPSPLPNPYTTQPPPPAFNYLASPYPHYEDFAQPPPQMQADYQHVSEAWYSSSQQQQQQMHHYPYSVRYQDQNQLIYLPQQQQQQGQQQASNAQPPFAPIGTNPLEPYKNRIVIPQPLEQQQQQQTIIGNIYYHPSSQTINQGIPPTNISAIGQQTYISTPPPPPQNLPPAIIHRTQPGSIDNLSVLVPPDRVVNNINQNVIGRKQPIQSNYSQQNDSQFSNFNTSINDVHNITSLLDSDNIYHPQQIPSDNQQVFFRQSSQPQQQPNMNFNMHYRQQSQTDQPLQSQGSGEEIQKQRQFNQKNYGMNPNNNNNQNNKQSFNSPQNTQNNTQNNYSQNNYKAPSQSKIQNEKIQKEPKNNNFNNKMNVTNSNSNNTNNQNFNTNYNNNPNIMNNNNTNTNSNNNQNNIGSSKTLQKQKVCNSNNNVGSSNNIEEQKVKEPKKPEVLEQTDEKKKGRLKFFDTSNNFGFFNLDEDSSDVFVHLDDLQVTTVPKDLLKHSSLMNLRFKFHFIKYIGKHKQSRKAVDIEYIPEESDETIQPQLATAANTQETNSQSSKNASSNTLNSFSSLSPDKKVRKGGPSNPNYKAPQGQQGYQNNNGNPNQNDNSSNQYYNNNNFKGQTPNNNNNNMNNQNNYNSNNSYNPNNNNNFNGGQYQKRSSYNSNNNNNNNNSNSNNNYNYNNNYYNNNNNSNNNYNNNYNSNNNNNNNNSNFVNNNNNSYKHNSQKTYPQNNGIPQRQQQY